MSDTPEQIVAEALTDLVEGQLGSDRGRILAARKIRDWLSESGWSLVRLDEPYCPRCGRLNRPKDGGEIDVAYCSPTNCSAWVTTATFDHATREWVPVGSGDTGGET